MPLLRLYLRVIALLAPEKLLAVALAVADRILVLNDGELVEQGRYAELVARGGLFAELDASGRFVPDAEDPADSYAEPTLTAL